jgi:hypothetical protein
MVNDHQFHRNIYGEMYRLKKHHISMGILVGVFYLAHPSPVSEGLAVTIDEYSIKMNSILTIAVVLRLFGILHFFIVSSRFYGARVARVL